MIQNKENKTLLKIGLLFGVALIITSFTIPYVSGVTIDYTAWEKKTRSGKYDVIVETLKDIF